MSIIIVSEATKAFEYKGHSHNVGAFGYLYCLQKPRWIPPPFRRFVPKVQTVEGQKRKVILILPFFELLYQTW